MSLAAAEGKAVTENNTQRLMKSVWWTVLRHQERGHGEADESERVRKVRSQRSDGTVGRVGDGSMSQSSL